MIALDVSTGGQPLFGVLNSPVLARWFACSTSKHFGRDVRVVDPVSGVVLATALESDRCKASRGRVPRYVLTAYALGAKVQVETARGQWADRRVIAARDGACYLREIH